MLPELGEKLGRYAQQKLAERGVEICPRTKVTGYIDSLVSDFIGRSAIPAATLIWTAGSDAQPRDRAAAVQEGKRADNGRRVFGGAGFRRPLGDRAIAPPCLTPRPAGRSRRQRNTRCDKPGTQRRISRRFSPAVRKKPFRFSTIGQLASIGHRHGVANILGMNFSGFIAWLLWRSAYLLKLPRLAKKTRVALSWLLEMIFSKDLEQMF